MAQILVIDDDVDVLSTLRRVLESQGWAVVEDLDGRDAVDTVRGLGVDLVITDILMPNAEGTETIMKLRKSFPVLPIIAMSGGGLLNPRGYLRVADQLGADATFEKPFDPQEIIGAVRMLLSRGRASL